MVPVAGNGLGGFADALRGVEAATNEVILLSLILLFIVSLENRFKRRTALRSTTDRKPVIDGCNQI